MKPSSSCDSFYAQLAQSSSVTSSLSTRLASSTSASTTAATTTTPAAPSDSSSPPIAAIAGGVVGGVLLLIAIVVAAILLQKRRAANLANENKGFRVQQQSTSLDTPLGSQQVEPTPTSLPGAAYLTTATHQSVDLDPRFAPLHQSSAGLQGAAFPAMSEKSAGALFPTMPTPQSVGLDPRFAPLHQSSAGSQGTAFPAMSEKSTGALFSQSSLSPQQPYIHQNIPLGSSVSEKSSSNSKVELYSGGSDQKGYSTLSQGISLFSTDTASAVISVPPSVGGGSSGTGLSAIVNPQSLGPPQLTAPERRSSMARFDFTVDGKSAYLTGSASAASAVMSSSPRMGGGSSGTGPSVVVNPDREARSRVSALAPVEVGQRLVAMGVGEGLASLIVANNIDGANLLALNDPDLLAMGVQDWHSRDLILRAVAYILASEKAQVEQMVALGGRADHLPMYSQ
ncbi:hypothetical protein HDU96_008777 [Phlyctochytrium bullatum]|nr:hypothetical protein HDU96_008777 [Phlyctochytrium bullatum]